MVCLEPAHNSQYEEQATVLLLRCGLSGQPLRAGCVVILAPALRVHGRGSPPSPNTYTWPQRFQKTVPLPWLFLGLSATPSQKEHSAPGACAVLGL